MDITENVGSKVYKSDLVGEAARQEFVTYFSNPPVFQVARAIKSKSSPFIRSIKVSAGAYIDSLTFEWSDNMSFKFGGNGGDLINMDLEKGEDVLWIKIYKYGEGNSKICGLEFRTNKWQTTGVLGKFINPTSLEAPRGYEIVGLYGGFDKLICGIGILYSKSRDSSFEFKKLQ